MALMGLFLSLGLLSSAWAGGKFPLGPDAQLTPGELCAHPDTHRYPEHIPYCSRNVDGLLKKDIIATYDRERNFSIGQMNRGDFKIDHFFPLCMGGGNDRDNLWPQHKSVYAITDPMEPLICQRMAEGKLPQAKAIELVKEGKNDLSKVPEIMDFLTNL